MEERTLRDTLYDFGIFSGGPKIVAIGGGTGLSVLLRGLKKYTSNITAIVTVADDGGSSGMLRKDYGILPPGDIRNCIMSLANTEPVMERLMQYRFKDGSLKGQSFGNLLLAALNDICGGFDKAIKEISNVLAVTGSVLPVTLEDIVLYAELENGSIIKGESEIPIRQQQIKSLIKRVFIEPANCKATLDCIHAIKNADIIVIGPGSLYTSIIPNLLVGDISDELKRARGLKLYISNIMTQKGETIGCSLSKHIDEINKYAGYEIIDYVIANSGEIPSSFIEKYQTEEASPVLNDFDNITKKGIKIFCEDFVTIEKNYVRHDYLHLSESIFKVFCDEKLSGNIKRLLDYYFVYDKLINS